MRIAVLDDEPEQLDLLARTLAAHGHEIVAFDRGHALLNALRRDSFDLLVVDWGLPDVSGIEVVQWVRAHVPSRPPVLFVTSQSEERSVVQALTAGADDYMVKPVRTAELQARVEALLRRSYPASRPAAVLQHGRLCFHPATAEATLDGEPVALKAREFDVAHCLFSNLGRLLSRSYLMETVWGVGADLPTRSLDTHVSALRSKLQLRPERGYRLTAVYGHGYRLDVVNPTDAAAVSLATPVVQPGRGA
jgi:DNA-binding response OmpR family regulator